MYCPDCLHPVDPRTGDHWHYCEYEATLNGKSNPEQPLTRLEMLNQKLSQHSKEVKKLNKQKRQVLADIKKVNAEISADVN